MSVTNFLLLQGLLTREYCEYEYDNLEIDGIDVLRRVMDTFGPGNVQVLDEHTERTHFGRFRIIVERL